MPGTVEILLILIILFPSFVIHEYAHAWTANRLGDPTAKSMGRLTLNPIRHVDLFGTVLLPVLLIGLRLLGSPFPPIALAKPVPVNFARLRNPKRGIIYVGMAGPAVNVVVALVASLLLQLSPHPYVETVLFIVIYINLVLAFFNMVPIPPLDGSRLVMGLLPNRQARAYSRLEPYGVFIVFALLPLGLFQRIVLPAVEATMTVLGVHV